MKSLYKNITRIVAASAMLLAVGTSCVKDLDTMPIDEKVLVGPKVYSTRDGYRGVLGKCYASLALTGQKGPAGDPDISTQVIDEGYSGYTRLLFYLQEQTTDSFIFPSESKGLRKCLNMTYDASNCDVVKGVYYRLYMIGAYCNEFLRESTESRIKGYGPWNDMKDDYKTMRAEVRLIRAYAYLMLCDLYGNVPIIDEHVGVKDLPVQKSRKEVFEYAEKELLTVCGELAGDEVLPEPGQNEYGRVDKCAAWQLLSRLYLNAKTWIDTERYADALKYAEKVINSNAYPLCKDWRHNFIADNHMSPELVWSLPSDGERAQGYAGTNLYVYAFQNAKHYEFYNTGIESKGWGNARCKTTFLNVWQPADLAFDVNDPLGDQLMDKRAQTFDALPGQTKETWETDANGVEKFSKNFTAGYSYTKWRNTTIDGQAAPAGIAYSSVDFPLLRSAECYLNAAEAILRGGGNRATALDYINEIRMRAYMSDKYAKAGVRSDVSGKITDAELTLDFILDERQREFATECQRRTDLVRYGKYTTGYNWDWKGEEVHGKDMPTHLALFPIPASELNANPTLEQNEGYAKTTAK